MHQIAALSTQVSFRLGAQDSAVFLKLQVVQVLRLCTEEDGVTSLISRSDCRKGLRWKSAEVEDPSSFMSATASAGEHPTQGFGCRVEKHEGMSSYVCLTRSAA